MSVEAISWALNLAPVSADRGGQPSSACKFVLVGLANHAGPDGTGAFPSVATLVGYTGLSERTVRTCLDRLAAGASSRRAIRASLRPGSSAPTGVRRAGTWTGADIAALGHQFPGLCARVAAAACRDAGDAADGVQSPRPVATGNEAVDNWPNGVQQLHPEPGAGSGDADVPGSERVCGSMCQARSHAVVRLDLSLVFPGPRIRGLSAVWPVADGLRWPMV